MYLHSVNYVGKFCLHKRNSSLHLRYFPHIEYFKFVSTLLCIHTALICGFVTLSAYIQRLTTFCLTAYVCVIVLLGLNCTDVCLQNLWHFM
jgi:hypothetical protein